MPNISIIISGGSSKGAYQIGFFKALIKKGLLPFITSASATSIGAINTYAFLNGKLDLAEQLWMQLDFKGIWNFRKKVINEGLLENIFSSLIKEEDNIQQDFYITLTEMTTMTAHHFNLKGKMNDEKKKLLKTTISIPLLTSVPYQYKDKIYFDGGVTDNIPFSSARTKNNDLIFIVHFTPGYDIPQKHKKDIIEINFSNSKNFIKGNFNYKQEEIKYMIEEGERFTLQTIDKFISSSRRTFTNNKAKDLYYYFSGARLLSILNYTLQIGKNKRVLWIKKLKNLCIGKNS